MNKILNNTNYRALIVVLPLTIYCIMTLYFLYNNYIYNMGLMTLSYVISYVFIVILCMTSIILVFLNDINKIKNYGNK